MMTGREAWRQETQLALIYNTHAPSATMTMSSSQPLSLPERYLIGSESQFQQQEAV